MPAGSTYTPIATTTLSTSQSSVTFNSFSGYTDLRLIMSIKNGIGGDYQIRPTVNGDGAGNYSATVLRANSALRYTNTGFMVAGWCNNSQYTVTKLDFFNYANTTTNKTVLSRFDNMSDYVGASVILWRNTAAITSITIGIENGQTMVPGSTFTLYGIVSA